MKIKRKYTHTLPKRSLPEAQYSQSRPVDNPEVNIIHINDTNLMNSIDPVKSDIGPERSESYSFCDNCEWNGYPNEKIIRLFYGYRSEEEDAFIYEFTEYQYPLRNHKRKHLHVFEHRQYENDIINSNCDKAISRKQIDNAEKYSAGGPIN